MQVNTNSLHYTLLMAGYNEDYIKGFQNAIEKSEVYSIDSFLEVRKEYISIGKICILYTLLRYEESSVENKNSNWYKIIWNKIKSERFEDLKNNRISFITYNYDRSLEHYLVSAMMSLYGKPYEDCYQLLNDEFKILHLHGALGTLDSQDGEYLEYGKSNLKTEDYKRNSHSIRIIHENIDNDHVFMESHKILQNTSQIIFLGFGYNQVNINRLKLNQSTAKIYGTCKGFTRNEIIEILERNSKIHPLVLDPSDVGFDCQEYIREKIKFV